MRSCLPYLPLPALCLCAASAAIAEPVLSSPQAFNPMSRTAQAITGPIIVSLDAIIFGNGARAGLEFIGDRAGDWVGTEKTVIAQVFRVTSNPRELLNGNSLCGAEGPTFIAIGQSELFGNWSLNMAVFQSANVPTDFHDDGLCGTYNFDLPDGPIRGGSSAESAGEVPTAEAAPEPEAPSDPGKWTVNRTVNPIDDSATVVARIDADQGRSEYGQPVTFVARCQSNTTEAYIDWNTYVGDDSRSVYDDWKYVTVRLGEKPSQEQRWGVSTDNEGTFAPDWAGTLLKQMVREERIVFQMTPYGANPITAIFDIRGLEGPLREIADECGWSF